MIEKVFFAIKKKFIWKIKKMAPLVSNEETFFFYFGLEPLILYSLIFSSI